MSDRIVLSDLSGPATPGHCRSWWLLSLNPPGKTNAAETLLLRLNVDFSLPLLHPDYPTSSSFPQKSRCAALPLDVSKGGVFIREDNRRPSPRQQRVIELVAQGLKNREIAKKLGIGEHVVRNYLAIIYDKVGVSNRVELALWYEARVHEGKFPPKPRVN